MERSTVANHYSRQGIYKFFMTGNNSNVICLFDSEQSENDLMFNAMYIDGEK